MKGFVHVQKNKEGKKAPLMISIGGVDFILVMRKEEDLRTFLHDGDLDSTDHCEFELDNVHILTLDKEEFDKLDPSVSSDMEKGAFLILLQKYMQLVVDNESVSYISGKKPTDSYLTKVRFTDEEWEILTEMAEKTGAEYKNE